MQSNKRLDELEDRETIIELAHITQINIVNGNDDSTETDRVELYSDHQQQCPKIKIRKPEYLGLNEKRTPTRLRGELMAEIIMQSENDHKFYKITISHHKGAVCINGPVETNPSGLD